ncbi:Thioredoxin reductase [Bhargavaea cecembensis DSE10]|uniref:Thioredoxin reductase n=1 Tax=Bhargavaea cecembensis DSE10 TaxID=1235279 RepID=M7NZ36_9BACL|nr:FAD-dependent oxidoreductase [Bhargavaea cecembensis]EMR06925.1 Thioredoxin reductase [Bhargavaea cecembensis DSE10]
MRDLIIIGSGPAGLTAAITAAEHGLDVLVLDEYHKPGGRLLGQLYEEPGGTWWNGIEESRKLAERAGVLGLDIRLGKSVHNIEQVNSSWLVHADCETFEAKSLLLATGAAEAPVAIPGWTLPGVMSVGAAQVMTNVHRVKPGKRGVIIGVNVLSSAIAMELKIADIEVAAIALPKTNQVNGSASNPTEVMNALLHVSHMAPSLFVKMGSKLMKNDFMKKMGITFYPKNGVRMWDIPVMLRKAVIRIEGTDQVEGVTLATVTADGKVIPGTEEVIGCDFVCIAGGLYPLAELAALTGCPFYHINELGGFVPLHSQDMRTPLDGLYVAGNITGIEGAKVAMSQGKTAALSIAKDLGQDIADTSLSEAVRQISSTRTDAHIQFHPEVDAGRRKLQEYWDLHDAEKRKVMV